MIKAVLVDDETLVKVGLKSLADWEQLGYEIVAEGSNGEEGLELIKKHNPQLVITDIVMPKMDGIEMMCKTKEYDPNIQVIVLSSYDEFQLVRRAMKLGAWDYILKLNISKESMNEILERVKETIVPLNNNVDEVKQRDPVNNYDNWSLSALRQVFLKGIIENSIRDDADIRARLKLLNMRFNESKMRLCIIETNLYSLKEKYCDNQDIRQIDIMLTEILTEIGNEFFSGYFLKWSFGEYVLVYSMDNESDEEISERTATMCSTIIEMIKKYMNLDAAIGISNICAGYRGLPEAFRQANEAIKDMFYSGYGRVFYYENEKGTAADNTEENEFFVHLKEELPKAISLFDITGIKNLFQTFRNEIEGRIMEKSEIYDLCTQAFCLCDIHMGDQWHHFKKKLDNDEIKIETVYSMRTISEISEWLTNFCSRVIEYMDECKKDDKHVMIVRAKNYIIENIERAINLKEVADHLSISEGYLSGLFSKQAGMCFTEYVNEVKIERAQQFIRQGQYKIYEISYMLGYDNACYFSKVFKKITGFTPTEYQQRCFVEQNTESA